MLQTNTTFHSPTWSRLHPRPLTIYCFGQRGTENKNLVHQNRLLLYFDFIGAESTTEQTQNVRSIEGENVFKGLQCSFTSLCDVSFSSFLNE